jgi:hypothetical protein
MPFSAAGSRLKRTPGFRELDFPSDKPIYDHPLLNEMPVVVIVVADLFPPDLAYLALRKPFVVLSSSHLAYSRARSIPNVFSVHLGGDDDLFRIYEAISSVLRSLLLKRNAPPALSKLRTQLEEGSLFSKRPRLAFIEPLSIAPPDEGMAASYLINRLANTIETVTFGSPDTLRSVSDRLEWLKLAVVSFALVEQDFYQGSSANLSINELKDVMAALEGPLSHRDKFDLILQTGRTIEMNGPRGVSFVTVPAIRSKILKGDWPGSDKGRRLEHWQQNLVAKSVREFCSDKRPSLSENLDDNPIRYHTQVLLAKEQQLLGCQATILAGRSFARPISLKPFVSGHFEQIEALQHTLYGQSTKAMQQFRAYQLKLASIFPAESLADMRDHGITIVFYSDLPLEWAMVEGLPLCLLRPVSRIPISLIRWPTLSAVMESESHISISHPQKTLVLDFMADHEAVKPYSRMMRNNLSKNGLDLTYASPRSPQAVIAELNANQPEIVFVDAHGRYDAYADKLYLTLGDTAFDVDILFGDGLVPKVWVMSSCQTTMTEALSGCIARKMLSRGAICVIGTLSSVEAMLASLFFSVLVREIYIGTSFPRSRTLDEAFHNTQIYMTTVWEPLLPLLRRFESDAQMTMRINAFLDELRTRRPGRPPEATLQQQLLADTIEMNECLERHGLLETHKNLSNSGRAFPETLLFSAFGFPKGVELKPKAV